MHRIISIVTILWCLIAVALFPGCSAKPPPASPGASGGRTSAPATATAAPINAKFLVLVRPPGRTQEPVPLEQSGALPVQNGGAMVVEVQLDQPAFAYLVWHDCQGRVVPLYPWNNESLEVTSLEKPPPVRRATNRIFSPLLGRDWPLADCQGMETVFLLVRRTALPESVQLGEFFKVLPTAPSAPTADLITLTLDADKQTVQESITKPRDGQSKADSSAEPVKSLIRQLGEHFEIVQAVQFAHGSADEKP
jgi:hypothetical protein